MKTTPVRLLLLLIALTTAAVAQPPAAVPSKGAPAAELDLVDAIVLGFVEGITEFLPVSSTGHLIIANQVLGLNGETPLLDDTGQPIWYKWPSTKDPNGVPMTVKLAADSYVVVIQFGAILAVCWEFRRRIGMVVGGLATDPKAQRFAINVVIATVPAIVLALVFGKWIKAHLFNPITVALAGSLSTL